MNNKERFSLVAITLGLFLAGWLDGQDHQIAQKYHASIAGQKLACVACAGGAK